MCHIFGFFYAKINKYCDLPYVVLLVYSKAKCHIGVAIRNCVAGLLQTSSSFIIIYKVLKAVELPASLSVIKRIGPCFQAASNVETKKESAIPKDILYRDNHLLKFTVPKNRKKLTKTVNKIQDTGKQDPFEKNNNQNYLIELKKTVTFSDKCQRQNEVLGRKWKI